MVPLAAGKITSSAEKEYSLFDSFSFILIFWPEFPTGKDLGSRIDNDKRLIISSSFFLFGGSCSLKFSPAAVLSVDGKSLLSFNGSDHYPIELPHFQARAHNSQFIYIHN